MRDFDKSTKITPEMFRLTQFPVARYTPRATSTVGKAYLCSSCFLQGNAKRAITKMLYLEELVP